MRIYLEWIISFGANCDRKRKINKFGDLIVLRISLINEIRGLIEEILIIQGWFRSKLQEIKVQGPLCKRHYNAGFNYNLVQGSDWKMLKHRGPNCKTATLALKRCRFTPIHRRLPLETEEATGEGKNKTLPRWAAQHKPNLAYQGPQSKQASSRTRYWNPGQSLPPTVQAYCWRRSLSRKLTPQAILIRRRDVGWGREGRSL